MCGVAEEGRVREGRKSKQIRRKKRKRERVACKSVIRSRKKAKAWCMHAKEF